MRTTILYFTTYYMGEILSCFFLHTSSLHDSQFYTHYKDPDEQQQLKKNELCSRNSTPHILNKLKKKYWEGKTNSITTV